MIPLAELAARHGISRHTLRDRARAQGLGQVVAGGPARRRLAFTDADAAQLLAQPPRGRRPNLASPPKHAPNLTPEVS